MLLLLSIVNGSKVIFLISQNNHMAEVDKNSNTGFQMMLNSGFSVNVIMAVRPFNTDVMAGDQFVPVYSPPGRRSSRPAAGPAVPSRCSPSAGG